MSPRELAVDVLVRVSKDRAYLSVALDAALDRSGMEPRDRALATELCYGVTRWQRALDLRLSKRVKRPFAKLHPFVQACLRLGAFQLSGLLRIPPHAAVSETVSLVKRRKGQKVGGFVNAVLRQILRDNLPPLEPLDAMAPWFSERVQAELGRAAGDFAASCVRQPWTGLRVEPHHASVEQVLDRLGREATSAELQLGRYSPLAIRAKGLPNPKTLPLHADGWISVQDEGAQAAALLLDVRPGQKVLDACAGRGGKTALFASLGRGKAQLFAADRLPRKLEQLTATMERIGLSGTVQPVAVDLSVGEGDLEPPFDRIFLDVPCSGTGTLARRPEIMNRLSGEDITRLTDLQGLLLDRCLDMLRPGGLLVYCSCSVLPEEGSKQVHRALAKRRDSRLVLCREMRLWPHLHGTDGFYAARVGFRG